ncbi:MAG: PAS domain S-box protein, partial [Gallionella sp.]|nr:PAS domain S-box protein [Gallionella sp.]
MNSIMPIQPSHLRKKGFPIRLFAAAFVIGLLATVFSGWQLWQMHDRFDETSAKHIDIEMDIGRIMLFDEVLTMSARMAAATGDFSYEKRYDEFDPQLTAYINDLRADLPQVEIAQFIGETDKANLALVKMERQAFALAHQGRLHEATALLAGDEYLRIKKVYAGGMEKTVNAAKGLIGKETRHLHSLSLRLEAASAIGIMVLLAVWFFAAKSARSWATERREAEDALQKAHDGLEVQVEQRTADLLDANEQLQREISERKDAEAKIHRLNQLYAALSQCNQAIVRCTDQETLFRQICRDAVQFGSFKMVWIGLVDGVSRMVNPVASCGDGVEYLEGIRILADADSPFGRGPTGTSIRENRPFWCQDFMNNPLTAPWHENGARFGWGSSASLPLHRNGVAVGAFTLYSGEANAFDEDARKLLVEMATDISFALGNFAREAERKQAIKLLEENEQHFRAVTESANDAIITADGAGNVMGWNVAAERLFGYTEAEMIGQSLAVLMPERFRSLHSAGLARVAAGGAPHVIGKTVELAGLRKDGSEFPLELSLAQWQAADGQFFTGIIRDITERKQAEKSLGDQLAEIQRARLEWQAVFDSISHPIFLHDGEFRITRANTAYAEAAGMDVGDVIGQFYWKVFPRSEGPMASCTRTQHSHKEESEEFRVDGKIYHSHTFFAEYIPGEQYSVHILEDITERKQAEAALLELTENLEKIVVARTADLDKARLDAEQANRAKSDFLATMSHEIRTPMNGVVGMIDVLQQSSLTGPQMEMANIIHDSAYSLLAIINDILDFSKIEAGKLQIENIP